MAEEKAYPMTIEGKQKLEEELNTLRTTKRSEIIERIKIARSFGDLSENSEYESAKDEQSFVEGRIKTIEQMLNHAEIIDNGDIDADEIAVGKTVTFQELPDEEPETYSIVGAAEADPFAGKISNESPIAKGLVGHRLGEVVEIETPGGSMKVKITEVK
ncbi:transcription elongation factor GreA [Liquorilactobacillus mali]|uniref:Transcription elongation factor GreA n=1 Tax=Liquorilactobacillus mali KCTC 3596 = DSM 20444 TaxID=1046596 RepID=J0L1U7_9LACO|nr:transcription elongation factor GreA [Liquorilactobacillus mali]EJF02131.1 transcription elongation factor GreA [Liquorilactobacillus mali KCTC 3596 = DSM 20444]KRN10268.1 transcription elongation factor GreA [Liquorilactobacillus mali KCTC 3596 = DSM 20444]MDC7952728.1 transcription elongation factor GreA [Liquorilactobacillus mali]MDV7757909.1 transcription elongation factor GreA [Liquorilactobacillus mali]QFQ74536.1 transcription elongation factor GreA [Liquorilactobacillus mali]